MITGIDQKVHPEKWRLAPHVRKLETSIIREILKFSSQPGVLSFAGGLPAPEMFPIEQLKKISEEVLTKYNSTATQYTISRGIVPLRELLARRASERGTPSKAENILITSGSQQGIELVARGVHRPW